METAETGPKSVSGPKSWERLAFHRRSSPRRSLGLIGYVGTGLWEVPRNEGTGSLSGNGMVCGPVKGNSPGWVLLPLESYSVDLLGSTSFFPLSQDSGHEKNLREAQITPGGLRKGGSTCPLFPLNVAAGTEGTRFLCLSSRTITPSLPSSLWGQKLKVNFQRASLRCFYPEFSCLEFSVLDPLQGFLRAQENAQDQMSKSWPGLSSFFPNTSYHRPLRKHMSGLIKSGALVESGLFPLLHTPAKAQH